MTLISPIDIGVQLWRFRSRSTKLRRNALAATWRDDHRWRIKRDLRLRGLRRLRSGLCGPGLMVGGRRPRQLAVGRRLDFETPIARPQPHARIVMADIGFKVDIAAAEHGRLILHALAEPETAFHDSIGNIDAIEQDRHARTAWNHQIESLARERGLRHGHRESQYQLQPHRSGSICRNRSLTEGM